MGKPVFFVLAFVLSALWPLTSTASEEGEPSPKAPAGFAVLELFTSEGCSSCPPADNVLGKLDAQMRDTGQPVYALAYHVDYWDGLGWPDRFASPAFTQRQRAYAHAAGSNRVYTPQLIVNGRRILRATDAAQVRDATHDQLQIAPQATLELVVKPDADGSFLATATLDHAPPHTVVHFALVQPRAKTDVKRGENAGQRLFHVGVVRRLDTVSPEPDLTATARLTPPPDASADTLEVVAFVQRLDNAEIIAAQRVPLAPPPTP